MQTKELEGTKLTMDLRALFSRTTVDEAEPAVAQQEYMAGSLLIDVREPHEYEAGHAPGAELLPLRELERRLRTLPSDREILFICRSGRRSGIATEVAERAGLKAKNVRGGMIAWSESGLPIER